MLEIGCFFIGQCNFIVCFIGIISGGNKQIVCLYVKEWFYFFYCLMLGVIKQCGSFCLCIWFLYGNYGKVIMNGNFDVERFSVLGNSGEVFFVGGGVNNEVEEIFSKVVDDEIIYYIVRGI